MGIRVYKSYTSGTRGRAISDFSEITKQKKYQNLPITMFMVADYPIISMRFTGNDKIDNFFNDNFNLK